LPMYLASTASTRRKAGKSRPLNFGLACITFNWPYGSSPHVFLIKYSWSISF
jgi:hypothetical protein